LYSGAKLSSIDRTSCLVCSIGGEQTWRLAAQWRYQSLHGHRLDQRWI